MNRREAEAIISALVTMREGATDEQALAASAIYPAWREGVVYGVNERVKHEGMLYRVLQLHTSQTGWEPSAAPSLFAQVLIPDPEAVPEWQQPDSTNGYMAGDKVTHNGSMWVSTMDNNVWEPGVYGWEVYNG